MVLDYGSGMTGRVVIRVVDPARLTIQVPDGVLAGADTAGWATSATLAAARRERVWRDLDAKADLLESVLAGLVHEIASAWR